MMINPNKHTFLGDLKRFSPLLWNLAVKDIKIKYRRSVLGVFWSILNPLMVMLVLTTVFSLIMRINIENFASYYIIGFSIWNFFSESTSLSLSSILSSASLIKKVYLPKYIFPLEKCIFALINFGFTLIAVFAVMMIQGVYPTVMAVLTVLPVFYCFIFSCGLSLILSALTVYFRDIAHLYGVLLTVWLYLTPVIYPVNLIENSELIKAIVRLNPLTYFVELLRFTLMGRGLDFYGGFLNVNLICIGFSVTAFLLGAVIFKKCEKNFILKI